MAIIALIIGIFIGAVFIPTGTKKKFKKKVEKIIKDWNETDEDSTE